MPQKLHDVVLESDQ